jgi:predicted RNA binding protein YcfA (HicA-like mRNA interferase family)
MLSSREVIKVLKADGWYEVATRGDHYQFKNPAKPGKVTVQHPVKDLSIRNLISIEKATGLRLRPCGAGPIRKEPRMKIRGLQR